MCATCGCGGSGPQHAHEHPQAQGHAHAHEHGHEHDHHEHRPVPETELRRISVEADLLAANDARAERNRRDFAATGTLVLNLVSSPGSGKTTLLVRTLERLAGRVPVAVIEGDQQTHLDADRIAATGVPVVQVNTGQACHLDAAMIAGALTRLPPLDGGVLFIENVGNLVCPAAFDLGEAHKVAVLSVTEGEDKPLKYPAMFRAADLVLVSKCDLLPYLDVEVSVIEANALAVNPRTHIVRTSATGDDGLASWLCWLEARLPHSARPVEALRA